MTDYTIAYDAKAANFERAGNHMQFIKTGLRRRFLGITFLSLVFLSFNRSYLHKIITNVFMAIILRAW